MAIPARVIFSIASALAAGALAAGCATSSPSSRTDRVPTSFDQSQLDPARFDARIVTPNRWLPLRPGTQWVRQGATDVGHRRVPHRVVSTVTDVTRRIAGVRTIAVLDIGIDSGQIAHESIDYFAQDRHGNVWDLGSYAEAYEAGRYVSVRDAWLTGVNGARAGILMPGDPQLRTPPWFIAKPPGDDPDVAHVVKTGRVHCVPIRCFTGVLVVREGKATAPDNEFKYYAAGVGQIDNIPRSASLHQDLEKLINLTQLTPKGLAEASAEAVKLDAHARTTPPRGVRAWPGGHAITLTAGERSRAARGRFGRAVIGKRRGMPEIIPRLPAPELTVQTLDHERFVLSERAPDAFTMIVFYRGLHCPVCRTYLGELSSRLGDFAERGVEVLALSGDDEARARQARDDWELGALPVGYGLSEASMHHWGLYVSRAIKDTEPDVFNEPGLFLVSPDGTAFYAAVNSMPFGRPKIADMLAAIDFIADQDYPARGEAARNSAASV